MITSETRAKLIGYVRLKAGRLPNFMLDESAAADLRAFVRARGKRVEFVNWLIRIVEGAIGNMAGEFDLIDATPAQQTAAFDAVFRDDLERINDKQS